MIGLGTILNIVTVLIVSSLGMLIGNRLPEKMQQSIIAVLGLVTIVIGVEKALGTANIIIPVSSLVIGGMLGEWLDVDRALQRFGGWLEARFGGKAEGD